MKATVGQKRKVASSGSDGNKLRQNDPVAEMSLTEFMQKGFSSDDEDQSAVQNDVRPKLKKKKLIAQNTEQKQYLTPSKENGPLQKRNMVQGKNVKCATKSKQVTLERPSPKGTTKSYQASKRGCGQTDSSEGSSEESSVLEEVDDDIADIQSDDEVIAKPRTATVEADSEDDELDEMELSEDDADVDLVDMDTQILTEKKLRAFLERLRTKPDTKQIKRLTLMFNGAVCEASGETDNAKSMYSVRGQKLFNAVVMACLQDLLPAVHKVMKLPPPSVPKDGSKMIDPTKGHLWRKTRGPLILYMVDLLKLIGCITQQKLLLSLLRHILLLLPFIRARPQIQKRVLKTLSHLWSTGEESVRVVSFLCLIRLVRSGDDGTFHDVLKAMYLSYVSNAKFTSPQTWPLISFMRRSLVEAYALRPNIAYQHSFMYIRQLAITLRTAMMLKKKDSHKAVYNWQFVHSLLLWCHLLAIVRTAAMQPLIYPVVQVALGVINLIPSEKYVPLRLHIIRGMIELSAETETFVPLMPILVSTLKLVRWNKKPKVVSMKPMNLSCALRVGDKQTKESAFRDAVLEEFQDMTLGYLTSVSHLLAFPEIVVPAVVDLKALNLRVVKHQTLMRQLLEKISENSRFIEKKRETSGIALKELEKIAALELQLRGETPLYVYAQKYRKLRELRTHAANEDLVENYDSEEDKVKEAGRKEKCTKAILSDREANAMDTEEDKNLTEDTNETSSDQRVKRNLNSILSTEEEDDDSET